MNVPSTKNILEMSRERDFSQSVPVRFSYCILSMQRSGSTLLSRALYKTGCAGDPIEYFNPALLEIERQRSDNAGLNPHMFLRLMMERRTSPNGYFGLKLHHHQWLNAFGYSNHAGVPIPSKHAMDFLLRQNALIWVRRRDRLGQGISLAIAEKTGKWSSEDGTNVDLNSLRELHPAAVVKCIEKLARGDQGWEKLLALPDFRPLILWYEDLVNDYETELSKVLRHLNIENHVSNIPVLPLERQSGLINEEIRTSVLAYLGLNPDTHAKI